MQNIKQTIVEPITYIVRQAKKVHKLDLFHALIAIINGKFDRSNNAY